MAVKGENSKTQRKSIRAVWSEQYRYAWETARQDLWRQPWSTILTIMVIAISLALPTTCYLAWKNIDIASKQWYPTPQLTVYLDKTLTDDESLSLAGQLEKMEGVKSIIYLPKEQALKEFREWSGFGEALDMLEDNPLSAVVMLLPTEEYQTAEKLKSIRFQLGSLRGIEDVRLDDGWFTRLTALTGLIALTAGVLATLMIAAVFLVIGNSIRLSIFSRRDTINVMKLIGATDGFILRPFLNGGAILGFTGALMALVMSQLLVWGLGMAVAKVAQVFSTEFSLRGISWDEALLLLLISTMIGWIAAWIATMRHLSHFSAE
jgi:cell division transport system permease protein